MKLVVIIAIILLSSFQVFDSFAEEPSTIVRDGMILEDRGLDPTGERLWVETDESYNQRIILPLIFNAVVVLVIIGIIVAVIYKVIKRSKQKVIQMESFSKEQLDFLENTSAEEAIKTFIQKGYGDKDILNNILKSIHAEKPISYSEKKYFIKLLEKTRGLKF